MVSSAACKLKALLVIMMLVVAEGRRVKMSSQTDGFSQSDVTGPAIRVQDSFNRVVERVDGLMSNPHLSEMTTLLVERLRSAKETQGMSGADVQRNTVERALEDRNYQIAAKRLAQDVTKEFADPEFHVHLSELRKHIADAKLPEIQEVAEHISASFDELGRGSRGIDASATLAHLLAATSSAWAVFAAPRTPLPKCPTLLRQSFRAQSPVAQASESLGGEIRGEVVMQASASKPSLEKLGTAASLAAIVCADVGLRRLFAARAIAFPSSLAGMLLIFASLAALDVVQPKQAAALSDALKPGCALLSKWLASFFVPNLVLLPYVLKLSASQAARLVAVITGGSALAIPLSAGAAIAAGAGKGDNAASSADSPARQTSPPPPPFEKRRINQLAAVSALTAVLSLNTGIGARALAVKKGLRSISLLATTFLGFVSGSLLPATVKAVLHPLVTCAAITTFVIRVYGALAHLPVSEVLRYYLVPGGGALSGAGNLLLFMLGPATISFGVQMYGRLRELKSELLPVAAATTASAAIGLFGTAAAVSALNLDGNLRLAALSRQVTAPLAIAIANIIGASPALAASIVVITGLLVANFGRLILDKMGVKAPAARGLAMGGAGHGLGTAVMLAEEDAFPFAAMGMALNAALSTILVSIPAVRKVLLAIALKGA